jgi:hypothetical protein
VNYFHYIEADEKIARNPDFDSILKGMREVPYLTKIGTSVLKCVAQHANLGLSSQLGGHVKGLTH